MNRSNNDELLQLIRSLTQTEKTYFKKYASRHVKGEQNVYVTLFDHIERNQNYHTESLRFELGENNFKNLSRIKNYLTEIILKSLVNYHREHSILSQLLEQLQQAEILWGKGLYQQTGKMLQKIKKKAISHDIAIILTLVYNFEQKLNVEKITINDDFKVYDRIHTEQNNALQNYYQRLIIEQHIQRIVFQIHLTGKAITQNDIEIYREIAENPIIQQPLDLVEDGYTKISLLTFHQLYAVALNRPQEIINYSNLIYDQFKKNPEIIPARLQRYLNFMYNRTLSFCEEKNYLQAFDTYLEYAEIPRIYAKYCNEEIFQNSKLDQYVLLFKIALESGAVDHVRNQMTECEQFFQKLEGRVYNNGRESLLCFLIALLYFQKNDHKSVLIWTNKILNKKDLHFTGIYPGVVNLFMITHWLMGNYDVNESFTTSVKRQYKKRNLSNSFEINVFKTLISYLKKPLMSHKQLTRDLKRMKIDLVKNNLHDTQNPNLVFFKYHTWIDSILENSDLAKYIQNQYADYEDLSKRLDQLE